MMMLILPRASFSCSSVIKSSLVSFSFCSFSTKIALPQSAAFRRKHLSDELDNVAPSVNKAKQLQSKLELQREKQESMKKLSDSAYNVELIKQIKSAANWSSILDNICINKYLQEKVNAVKLNSLEETKEEQSKLAVTPGSIAINSRINSASFLLLAKELCSKPVTKKLSSLSLYKFDLFLAALESNIENIAGKGKLEAIYPVYRYLLNAQQRLHLRLKAQKNNFSSRTRNQLNSNDSELLS
jgi:hypothetical protein